jgi:hypothetical protein
MAPNEECDVLGVVCVVCVLGTLCPILKTMATNLLMQNLLRF